jgi:hypothetical protein
MTESQIVYSGQIEDEFTGWDGETLFTMTDGTHWIQDRYNYWYHYAYRPQVVIERVDGGLYLRLDGRTERVAVRQIDVIESTIRGEFRGWDGQSEYTLTNGQTWRQKAYHYTYKYAYRPRAIVYNPGGGHIMVVKGTKARVRRV